MSVLTDLKARGTEDILITATDNLNGFTETIRTVFPEYKTQICIVHQIRNPCKYVVWKDKSSSLQIRIFIMHPIKMLLQPLWKAL